MANRREESETLKALRADPRCKSITPVKSAQAWVLNAKSLAAVKQQLGKK